ncbi:MAG: hypothetical protein L6Q83_06580 [Gammaproteobacteria bacterium]|nr:hypothetical protein [Gammaproteobacteria bacterium]
MEHMFPATFSSTESVFARDIEDSGLRLDARQRASFLDLERQLHRHWRLGGNLLLAWCLRDRDLLLLVTPHYAIADYNARATRGSADLRSGHHEFLDRLLTGSRRFCARQMTNAARLLDVEPVPVPLRYPLSGSPQEAELLDRMIRRFGVSYVPGRAVALFDIVGFSLLGPFEQMTQLNSLAYSLNSAYSKMLESRWRVSFSRSGTGDGFYIWSRDSGIAANTSLYHLMHLVLADNAIARRKARARTVPLLRACFHIGGCYEFHHAEELNPTLSTQIVGEVTIELARMVERAMPGQILMGAFDAELPVSEDPAAGTRRVNAVDFVDLAQTDLSRLSGLELSGESIESIKCYLTGRAQADGTFTVRRLAINDKHGLTHNVFNAKVNIYRRAAEPILLGIEDRHLRGEDIPAITIGHITRHAEH